MIWSVNCDSGDVSAADFDDSADPVCPSGVVTIVAGSTSASFTIMPDVDSVVEGLENLVLTLIDLSTNIEDRITIADDTIADDVSVATVTIMDNTEVDIDLLGTDQQPLPGTGLGRSVSVPEDVGSVSLTVILDSEIEIVEGVSVVVDVMTIDGTAFAPGDYTTTTETLTFTSSITEATVTVSIFDDSIRESDEFFRVVFSGESVSPTSATVTILDDDFPVLPPIRPGDPEGPSPRPSRPRPSPSDPVIGFERGVDGSLRYSVSESDGSVTLTVLVLSGEIDDDVVVNVRTRDGSAVEGRDYTALTEEEQTFTLTSRMTEMTVTVPILDDRDDERDEFFQVELYIRDDSSDRLVAEVTILDNDDRPSPRRLLPPTGGNTPAWWLIVIAGLVGAGLIIAGTITIKRRFTNFIR